MCFVMSINCNNFSPFKEVTIDLLYFIKNIHEEATNVFCAPELRLFLSIVNVKYHKIFMRRLLNYLVTSTHQFV